MIKMLEVLRRRSAPVTARYVRKPKVHRDSTYASRAAASAGKHAQGARRGQISWQRLADRLHAERAGRAVRPRMYRGARRAAPAGVAVLLRRAHGMARRAPSAARSRVARVGDLTGEIPRAIRWHGAGRPWFHLIGSVGRDRLWKIESAW